MTDWTIGRKLFSTFGVLLALVLFASGVSAWVSSQLNAALDEAIGQTHEVALTWKLSDTVTSLGGLQRDAILTAGTQDRSAVNALAAVGPMLDREVDELTRALAEQSEQALARDVREGLREWEQITSEVLKLAGAGERDRALELARVKGDPIIARAEGLVSTLLKGHEEAIAGAEAEGEQLKARTTLTLIAIVVAVLLVGAAAVWIVRGVNRSLQLATEDLRGGAEQVAAASVQVSTSAQSLSQGATEQAASLEETSASMEEIAATTRQNREHSQQAAELMADVHRQVTQFNEAVQTLVRSMAGIRDSSDRVSKILKTIDEIAFQTNILALNAAVEAARAGDAGMGFAVVADEVRSLSQRSAVAAKNTADLVEASNAAAAQGVREMDQAVKAIAEITANVAKVNVLVEEVSLGSQQQAQGIDQVTQAISQLETVTQTTAATSEESAAASEELSTQAETTMAVVQRLAAMVNGAKAGEPATTAEPARRKGNVLPLSRPGAPTRARLRNPEREIPLADTGSFGKF